MTKTNKSKDRNEIIAENLMPRLRHAFKDMTRKVSDKRIKRLAEKIVADIGLDNTYARAVLHVTDPKHVKTLEDRAALCKLMSDRYGATPIALAEFIKRLASSTEFNGGRLAADKAIHANKLAEEKKRGEPSGIPIHCPRCSQLTAYSTIKAASAPGSCGGKMVQTIFIECSSCGVVSN